MLGQKEILTLEKRVESEQNGYQTVTYRIHTEQDTKFRIRLYEQIPDWRQPKDLDFGPWHDVDDWTIRDETAVFEGCIEPGDDLFTEYRRFVDGEDTLESLDERPSIEVARVTGAEDEPDEWVELADKHVDVNVVNDRASPTTGAALERDGGEFPLKGTESYVSTRTEHDDTESPDTGTRVDADIESSLPTMGELEAIDGEETGDENETATEDGDEPSGDKHPDEESVVADLVTALQRENLSEEQKHVLREVLGNEPAESMNARIEHCQARVSDLEAYIDALEEFLDEEGTGQQLIAEFQSDLEAVETQLEGLESEVTQTASGQEELRERVSEVEREVSDLREIGDTVESLEAHLDDTTASLQAEIDELRTSLEDVKSWQQKFVEAFRDTELVGES